jgi:hypothetical protein
MPVERCKHEGNNKEEMDQLGSRVMVREGDSRSPTLTPSNMALGSGHIFQDHRKVFFLHLIYFLHGCELMGSKI